MHTSEDEKNTVFLSTFNSEIVVDKRSLTEERPKEIREIEVDSIISNGDSSSSNVSLVSPELHKSHGRSRKFGSRDVEIESSEGTDEEDEQDREANNKAVQWTETDQKNLMDLGLSEIERNKRLESLIARRRARKMLSLQVRSSPPKLDNLENHGPMTSLTMPRNSNPLLATQPNSNLFSPMPGSAPSVLLPNCNPFDLPYDAQEEKPILTGGSFQLEFKDMTLVRPENVGSAALVPGVQKEDQQQTSLSHDSIQNEGVSEDLQNFQVKTQLDEKDAGKIIEVDVCQSPNSKLNSVTTNPIIEEEVSDSKQEADLVSNCQEENNGVWIENSTEKLSSASSSEEDVSIYKVDKDAVLRSLGSPLLRSMSINREESWQMEYVGNNCIPTLFEKNKMLEHLYHADKPLRLSLHTPMSSIASDLQVEVSEVSSPMLTDDGITLFPDVELSAHKEDMVDEITNGNEDIRETSYEVPWIHGNESKGVYNTNEDNTVDVGFSGRKDSENDNLAFPVMDKMQQLKEDLEANISRNDDSEKPEHPPNPCLMSMGEFSSTVLQNNDEEFNIRAADDTIDPLMEQGKREPTKLPETSGPQSADYTGSQSEKIEECHSILELVGKNVEAEVSADIEGESEDSKQGMTDDSVAIQDHDTQDSIQVDEEELHMEELRSSGVHPHLSTSTPRSVLQPNISLGPCSLSRFSDDTQFEVHQFQPERVENIMVDEASDESSTLAQSTMSAETLKESSDHSTSTVEANSIGSVRKNMVQVDKSKQNITNYIPEGSSERQETSNLITCAAQDNPLGAVSQKSIHENEMAVCPEDSSRKLGPDTEEVSANSSSSYGSEAALSKTTEETNSYSPVSTPTEETNSIGIVRNENKDDRSLTVTDDSCDELHKHKGENEALPALHNPIEQANREITMNAPAESSVEEEINGNPNAERKL